MMESEIGGTECGGANRRGHNPARRWLAAAGLLATAAAASAADSDLPGARQLISSGDDRAAYGLLAAFEAGSRADVALLLGEAALRLGKADDARRHFERSLAAAPDAVDAHLGLGRAYLAMGDYGRAKIEFETVLRFDELPTDLQQQAVLYAEAARARAEGQRLFGSAYGLAGLGNYRTNATPRTDAFGGADTDDNFVSLRAGGNLNCALSDNRSLSGSLDYRYRHYDNEQRRDDADLRWNGVISRTLGEANLAVGVRGRVSYRGNGNYRNDVGLYGSFRYRADADNQYNVGAEFRRRNYPQGPLRARSRNIAELTGGWTRALPGGQASFNLAANGGREFATDGRIDGDAGFFGLRPRLTFSLDDALGGFVSGSWQHFGYRAERLNRGPGDEVLGFGQRNDELYELGAGLSWRLARGWSVNPEIFYTRDRSNILVANYSSTEVWLTVRKDF